MELALENFVVNPRRHLAPFPAHLVFASLGVSPSRSRIVPSRHDLSNGARSSSSRSVTTSTALLRRTAPSRTLCPMALRRAPSFCFAAFPIALKLVFGDVDDNDGYL